MTVWDFCAADHSVFLTELETLQADVLEAPDPATASTLAMIACKLARHDDLLRWYMAPAFDGGRACRASVADAWAADTLRLFELIDRARGGAAGHGHPLEGAVARLLDRLQDHLVSEATLFGPWARDGSCQEGPRALASY